MLARRIVPCLDVAGGKVVKGVRFRAHRVMGEIVDFALRYRDEGADELVFYDIQASPQGRIVDPRWVEKVARVLDIPFVVAGGIRSVADARGVLHAGADKISINTPALVNPGLIDELVAAFGSQCIVIGIDSLATDRGYEVKCFTGDPQRTEDARWSTLDWVKEAQRRGAGEIVLNCMNRDGVRRGYDVRQLRTVRAHCRVPLVASGGAGSSDHFLDVIRQADVDAALAASVFHEREIRVRELKDHLAGHGVEVRR